MSSRALSRVNHMEPVAAFEGVISPSSPVEVRFKRALGAEDILKAVMPKAAEPIPVCGWKELFGEVKEVWETVWIKESDCAGAFTEGE